MIHLLLFEGFEAFGPLQPLDHVTGDQLCAAPLVWSNIDAICTIGAAIDIPNSILCGRLALEKGAYDSLAAFSRSNKNQSEGCTPLLFRTGLKLLMGFIGGKRTLAQEKQAKQCHKSVRATKDARCH